MKYLLIILSTSILLSGELEVDGDLKVTGTIQSATIDSLLSLIAQLEMRIAQLECQNTGIIPDGYCDCFFHTLDECGVCDGDTTTCQDCAGVPNGDNLQDMCGYCDNDSSNDCVQDCFGEWGGAAEYDECGICDGTCDTWCGCDGICEASEDACGVCGGDALSEDECLLIGHALKFDGVDDYVAMGNWFGGGVNNNFTISVRVNIFNAGPAGDENGHIILHRAHFNDKQILHFANESLFEFYIRGNSSQTNTHDHRHYDVEYNMWYYLTMTSSDSHIKYFVNGIEVYSANRTEDINWDNDYYGSYFGGDGYSGETWGSSIDGLIHQVDIWDRALNEQEIQGNTSTELNGNETGLIGYWKFDEGSGGTVYDHAGSNHGTIHGANWVTVE